MTEKMQINNNVQMLNENNKENKMQDQINTSLTKDSIIELIKLAANYDECASKIVSENETLASNEEKQQITKEFCRFWTEGLIELLYQKHHGGKNFLLILGCTSKNFYNTFVHEKDRNASDNPDKTETNQSITIRRPKYVETFHGRKYIDLSSTMQWLALAVDASANKHSFLSVFLDDYANTKKEKREFVTWLKHLIWLKIGYLGTLVRDDDSGTKLTDEEIDLLEEVEDSDMYEDLYDIFYNNDSFFKKKKRNQSQIITDKYDE